MNTEKKVQMIVEKHENERFEEFMERVVETLKLFRYNKNVRVIVEVS